MGTKDLIVPAEAAGQRLDAFLSGAVEELTRSAAIRLLEEGAILCNGAPVRKNYRLQGGEEIVLSLPQAEALEVLPQNIPLDIRYEDGDVIVVNKPVGLVVHPAPGHPDGTLVNALLYHCGTSLSGINGQLRPGIVHRIDRDTSGLLIVAKNDLAHQALSQQLQDHSLHREYQCICQGHLREEEGTISAPIARHKTDRKKMAVDFQGGREAVTHWQVITPLPGCTHLRCRLETGRTHQIRVHLSHIGHPILGDPVYGSKKPYPGLVGQCLHAGRLTFRHPRTGEEITVSCPLPDWFQAVLTKLSRGL